MITLRQKIEFAGLSAGARFVARLPFGFLPALATATGSIIYWLDFRSRKVALDWSK